MQQVQRRGTVMATGDPQIRTEFGTVKLQMQISQHCCESSPWLVRPYVTSYLWIKSSASTFSRSATDQWLARKDHLGPLWRDVTKLCVCPEFVVWFSLLISPLQLTRAPGRSRLKTSQNLTPKLRDDEMGRTVYCAILCPYTLQRCAVHSVPHKSVNMHKAQLCCLLGQHTRQVHVRHNSAEHNY